MFRLEYLMLVVLVVICLETAKKKFINPSSSGGANCIDRPSSFPPRLRNQLINLAIFVVWFLISSHRGCREHCASVFSHPVRTTKMLFPAHLQLMLLDFLQWEWISDRLLTYATHQIDQRRCLLSSWNLSPVGYRHIFVQLVQLHKLLPFNC